MNWNNKTVSSLSHRHNHQSIHTMYIVHNVHLYQKRMTKQSETSNKKKKHKIQ